jgi:membrane protease YdiL (CAAX protease family)
MSLTPTTPQEAHADVSEPGPQLRVVTPEDRKRRLLALGIVLFVSFGHFIAASAYYLMETTAASSTDLPQLKMRLVGAMIAEAGSLAVLWYVLSGQRRGWKNIGWKLHWTDVPRALILTFGATVATYATFLPVQIVVHVYSGHYLTPKSTHGVLGVGISALSIAFICLNPFFEELIVRGYLMTEIVELGGSGVSAIVISVAVQMSYHLYQGFTNGIVLATIFAVFSIYFWKTRRLAPVVLAHLCVDAYALFRGSA